MQTQPDFYTDTKKVSEVGKRISHIENLLEKIDYFQAKIDDMSVCIEMLEAEQDDQL